MTLPGAGQGVKFLLLPEWRKLAVVQVRGHTRIGCIANFLNKEIKKYLIMTEPEKVQKTTTTR